MRQVALDASSTTIGYVVSLDGEFVEAGTRKLRGATVVKRIQAAYDFVTKLLEDHPGTRVLITEAPGGRFMKGVLPQVRVNGVIILACQEHGVQWGEVTASEAKFALTGSGKAQKADMVLAAAPRLGYDKDRIVLRGKSEVKATLDNEVVYDEHLADAVGIWLAAQKWEWASQV